MARPRRSGVPTSYAVAFPSLSSSSSGGESNDDGDAMQDNDDPSQGGTEAGPSKTAAVAGTTTSSAGKRPRKKSKTAHKARTPASPEDDDDSASGSEYAPDAGKNGAGKDGDVDGEASEDSAEFDAELVEEEEDGDSHAGEAELDGDEEVFSLGDLGVGDDSEGEDRPSRRNGKGAKTKGRARIVMSSGSGTARVPTAPPMRITNRPSIFDVTGQETKRSTTKRNHNKKKDSSQRRREQPAYDLEQGCSFYPSQRLALSADFDDPAHCPPVDDASAGNRPARAGTVDTGPLTEKQRALVMRRQAHLPFGPISSICEDYGWYKGKYVEEEGEPDSQSVARSRRAKRWGGWYEEVDLRMSRYEVMHEASTISPYLPKHIYPSVPSRVHLTATDEDATKNETENDDSLWDIGPAASTSALPPMNLDGLPTSAIPEPSNAQEGEGDMSLDDRPSGLGEQSLNGASSVRFSVGLAGTLVTGERQGQAINQQKTVTLGRFQTLRLDSILPHKPGWLLNAGGPVWGLDWFPQADAAIPSTCEYLAVSTVSSHPTSEYRRGKAEAASSRNGTIQIWSLQTSDPHDFGRSTENKLSNEARHGSSHPRLDLCLLLTDEVYQLKWCPRGGDSEDVLDEDEDQGMQEDGKEGPIKPKRLGILAALHTDWSLVLYEIPRPEDARAQHSSPEEQTLHLRAKAPLLVLDLGAIPILCFDWASHTTIYAGCTNGFVAVFHIEDALRNHASSVGPTHYFPMHEAPIRAICTIREPGLDGQGKPILDSDPPRLATSSLDGSTKMVDLADPACLTDFGHERATRVTLAYQPNSGGLLFGDQDIGIRYLSLRPCEFGSSTRIVSHNGPITDIAASDFHCFEASASADGSCAIGNVIRRHKRGGHALHFLNKLYRMDFDRKNGELRMLDNIVPDHRITHEGRTYARQKNRKQKKKSESGVDEEEEGDFANVDVLASMAWPSEVAINRVAWSKSIRRAQLLASGMACGLVRIDITTGVWSSEGHRAIKDPDSVEVEAVGDDSDE